MRRILFLTGTRADYGKLKPLITETAKIADVDIFVTGMHLLKQYGMTVHEISKDGFSHYPFINQDVDTPADRVLAKTIEGLSYYLKEHPVDMLVLHGDRPEALAGAIVGNFNGILTAHIEGGELSGHIDGITRHAITKLAHVHFCANSEAARRLVAMGEEPNRIYAIGSPEVDMMLSPDLPALDTVTEHYKIPYSEYGILIYHPVTGELPGQFLYTLWAARDSGLPFVVIYPNNDPGSQGIIRAIDSCNDAWMYVLPSTRFEYFLTLLKNAKVILGNSSAGVREAPVYGVPSVNVGTRQSGRVINEPGVVNVADDYEQICAALANLPKASPSLRFGCGDSAKQFVNILSFESFWKIPRQKQFWEGDK